MYVAGRRRVRSSLLALVLVLLVLAPASPASARRLAWNDATGDMWRSDLGAGTDLAAPEQSNGDIRRVVVRNRLRALLVHVSFVDLERSGSSLGVKGDIRTSAGRTWHFDVLGEPGAWRGRAELLSPDYRRLRCGTSGHLDFGLDTLDLRIPHACLHRPRWVRLAFDALRPVGETIFEDNALGRPLDQPVWTARIGRG